MKIAIVGAGSLGLLFAGKLSTSENFVTLAVHTEEQAREISAHGVQVEDVGGRLVGHPQVIYGLSGLEDADWIFLMVKQPHIDDRFVGKLTQCMSASANLLCFQNGIGHVQQLSRWISADRIYVAVTTEAARKISHAKVIHTGMGRIWIGRVDKDKVEAEEFSESLVKMFHLAGFKAFTSKTMESVVWNKLIINAVINPLTAILRISNGELLSSVSYQSLMRSLFDEGLKVASLADVKLADDLWEQLQEVCRRTAENRSSMLQDLQQGKKSEIEWINGSLIRLASAHGIELPAHTVVYQMIQGLEGGK